MPPLFPLPAPIGVGVAQTGTAALWNATMPPAVNFLANRPYACLWQTVAQTIPAENGIGNLVPIAFDAGFDNAGGHSTTVNNSQYVCQLAGLYHVVGQLAVRNPAPSGSVPWGSASLAVGPITLIGVTVRYDVGAAAAGGTVQISGYAALKPGQTVKLTVSNEFVNPVTTWTGPRCSRLFVHWVST